MKRLSIIGFAVALFASTVSSQTPTPTPFPDGSKSVSYMTATWSPDSRSIVFTRMDITHGRPMKMEADIYSVAADGTGLKRVTDLPGNEIGPSWSKDGRVFYGGVVGEQTARRRGVFVTSLDGLDPQPMAKDLPGASSPSVSADGKWIAFTVDHVERKPQIYVMRSDGTGAKRLTNDDTVAFYNPVFSPDGKWLVYYVERGDNKDQIWSMKNDGSGQRLLTNNIGHNFYPSFTADGKRIIFTSTRDGKQLLYTMGTDGSDVKTLGIESSWGRQSPDGKKIVYIAGRFPTMDLYVANADGSNPVKISN